MHVRPATVDDAGRVAEVHVLSWQVGYRGLLPQPFESLALNLSLIGHFKPIATGSLFLSDARSEVLPIRMWHIIEASLDVRAAAASGVLIAATILLGVVMERLAGISRHLR